MSEWLALTEFCTQNFSIPFEMSFKCRKIEFFREKEKSFMPGSRAHMHVASIRSVIELRMHYCNIYGFH